MHADGGAGRVPALGQQLGVAEHIHLAPFEGGKRLRELALRSLARDRLGVDPEFPEGSGDILRVLDTGRVKHARCLAEA